LLAFLAAAFLVFVPAFVFFFDLVAGMILVSPLQRLSNRTISS